MQLNDEGPLMRTAQKRYVGFVHADGERFGFVIRDSARRCPAIHGYGNDVRAAVRAVVHLLRALYP
jgi:hypothetical protein